MPMNKESNPLNPAVITVGNELTFGERRNGNQEWLCQQLFALGFPATVVMSLPDEQDVIAHWIRTLKSAGHYPILVSGGIGGTHDDCTRQSIASGLGVALTTHQQCYSILAEHYGDRFTEQRKRMTQLPENCALIDNPLGAPGFSIDGVYGFPGFPNMLQPMFETVSGEIFPDQPSPDWQSMEYALAVAEGDIAMDVEQFDQAHDQIHLGIYPSTEKFRREVTVRLRYPKHNTKAASAFETMMQELAGRHGVELIAPS